jgi:hypothetical protein
MRSIARVDAPQLERVVESVNVMDASGVVEPPGSNTTLAVREMLP